MSEAFTSIADRLFFPPDELHIDSICILSAHAMPSMASWLLTSYAEKGIKNREINLIITSVAKEGISSEIHNGFKMMHDNPYAPEWLNFTCSYLNNDISLPGENIYIWLSGDEPVAACLGELEFTQKALLCTATENKFHEMNPIDAYNLYSDAVNSSTYCFYNEIEEYVIIRSDAWRQKEFLPEQKVNLSFITRNGDVGKKSGLNWGQRAGRNQNEAYIPLPRNIAQSGFFPLEKRQFFVTTDDRHSLLLRIEQQGDKAITTPLSNALLGEYFRNRLNLSNGEFITKETLEKYGRTDVTFVKIDDEQYYMDFSVKKA